MFFNKILSVFIVSVIEGFVRGFWICFFGNVFVCSWIYVFIIICIEICIGILNN